MNEGAARSPVTDTNAIRGRDRSTIHQLVADEVDEPVEVALVRANEGTLSRPRDRWYRYDSADALPHRAFEGWDELFVFTEPYVYHWVAVGYNAGPTRLPRHPAVAMPDGVVDGTAEDVSE